MSSNVEESGRYDKIETESGKLLKSRKFNETRKPYLLRFPIRYLLLDLVANVDRIATNDRDQLLSIGKITAYIGKRLQSPITAFSLHLARVNTC